MLWRVKTVAPNPIQELESDVTNLAKSIKTIQFLHDPYLKQLEKSHKHRLEQNQIQHKQILNQERTTYDLIFHQVQRILSTQESNYWQALQDAHSLYAKTPTNIGDSAALAGDLPPLIAPWDSAVWHNWTPSGQTDLLQGIRLGRMVQPSPWNKLTLLGMLPFIGVRSLLLKVQGSARTQAVRFTHSLMLRLLAVIPPGQVRFTFIDPVGLGQNVAAFLPLGDYDQKLVTNRAWTEPRHIEQRLTDITKHMTNVIQSYLRNQYATIEEYNEQAVAEPYRVLVVMGFPVNFNEDAARRLVSITQNGPRCGVYTIVLADTSKPLPNGLNMSDLEQSATVIAWNGKRFVWEDEDFKHCLLQLDTPPEAILFNRILHTVGEAAKNASQVAVPFERIAPPPAEWWTKDSRKGLLAALGPTGARKQQYLHLNKGTAQHGIVAGKTGSGKSTLFHVLITSLALAYSPDEVQLYLIDFKQGVEFNCYAKYELPHARVIAIESEREFGLSVLQGLDDELTRRSKLCTKMGVSKLADYRSRSGQAMPRILLLVDEFQVFFNQDDLLASQASRILDHLVRQGRSFGIHLLLSSQTLAGQQSLARSTMEQMTIRIALQCSEADSRIILADDNPAARLLSRPGEAIYNDSNGMVEGNNIFQVAWLSDDERDDYLTRIRTKAEREGLNFQPIIFEGNAPAEIKKDDQTHPLNKRLVRPAPIKAQAEQIWLGKPIALRNEPSGAIFHRQSGCNLLMVGQDNQAARSMMAISLISLAAQIPPAKRATQATFYILNFAAANESHADLLPRLAKSLPHSVQIGGRRQLAQIINTLAEEVQRRIEAEENFSLNQTAENQSIYLLIYGLQRARDLRQEDSYGGGFGGGYGGSYDDDPPPSPAQQFPTILRDGPEVGIHTIVWCDTVTNLNRRLNREALREFVMRIAFQMSADDSTNLIDSPAASKIGANRALFYDEEENRLEKFRPYGLPSKEWLEWASKQLHK